ncbi:MAG TPA: hypothetical protein VGB78_05480 [Thermoplasmata archaeon]
MTKGILLSYSGHAYAEDVNTYKRYIQFEGGDFLVSKNSVQCDVDHMHDPIMIVKQGLSAPEGDTLLASAIHESDRIKLHGQAVQRDKMWVRRLFSSLWKLLYVMTVFVFTVTIYLLIWVFTWAWFHVWLPI